MPRLALLLAGAGLEPVEPVPVPDVGDVLPPPLPQLEIARLAPRIKTKSVQDVLLIVPKFFISI